MFNITHTSKPGLCKARRCKSNSVEDGLCPKHHAEWSEAGRPTFGSEGTAVIADAALPLGTEESLADEKNNAERALTLVQSMEITTQEQMDDAGVFLNAVREFRADLKKRRDVLLVPVENQAEGIRLKFGTVDVVYGAAESDLRGKMNAHIKLQEAAQAAARAKVEAAGGQVDEDTLVVAHGVENVALPVGYGVTETWTYEITDERLLRRAVLANELVNLEIDWPTEVLQGLLETLGVTDVVPAEALIVDTKWLAAQARSLKDQLAIPGVKPVKNTSTRAARRGK